VPRKRRRLVRVHEQHGRFLLSPEGYEYLPAPIPPDRLNLVCADTVPLKRNKGNESFDGPSGSIDVIFRDT
jgi:hypothetical protein